jgi:hypothetical protein
VRSDQLCLRQDGPFQKFLQPGIATDRALYERVVHICRLAPADRTYSGAYRVVIAPAVAMVLTPNEVATPEGEWRRRGEDLVRVRID